MLLGLWLFIALLAAVPQFHRVLHADSDSPTHHCVVEKLTSSSFIHGPAADVHVDPVCEAFGSAPAENVYVSSVDLRLSPSRAPPHFPTYLQVAG
jgi:hypothetical protein